MGMTASTTTQVIFDEAVVPADQRIGAEGDGMKIALSALDSGRLGIAACATGLAQGALESGCALCERAASSSASRSVNFRAFSSCWRTWRRRCSRRERRTCWPHGCKDAGKPFSTEASVAKLIASDAAMKVTTDAVQVLGGYGYTRDFPAERFMREAKVTQIFEGTNQIQRMVIARNVLKSYRA